MKKIFLLSAAFLLTACTPADDITPHTLGNSGAPVLIEEFSDLQCPACGAISPELKRFVDENPDLAQLKFYHFPLSQHPFAFVAAEGAECAADQGKFWEFTETVFANQPSLSQDYVRSVAESLKLNQETFNACLDDHVKKGKVLAHLREGNIRNVAATPTIYVNGEIVKWPGYETFEAYVKGLESKE